MKTILTHTGKIYVDTEHKLEFLTVGDYGKENNIKANFLGLTKEINGFEVTGYSDYNVYRMFEQPLLEEGWDVIVPSKEEDSDRITCVNSRRTYLTIIN